MCSLGVERCSPAVNSTGFMDPDSAMYRGFAADPPEKAPISPG
jgi:hypothetical protein